ncbi:F-box/WD repeat-containing protein 12 [Pteropus vampyrus]|uniref:F-box/WD repeat-containing protein 12 n=1 Tax=Pteropus vampyrus TaxID=132908 RepID=A0A6P6BML7_PTEVA|nr:F-box/WD repeat-containing protein 12 [Pteropus vampyrus]
MDTLLPEVPLLKIFSFLDAFSLLQVCQVNKYWNKVAENDHLWRNLCLEKWSFCHFSYQCLGAPTWKHFFLSQRKRERRMALAQPEDFLYREAAGNLGILEPMAYLSGSSLQMNGREKSILCTVSSKRMLYAWDVQEGIMIWSSPVQRSSIRLLETLPQMHLAFTVDLEGTVKVWNCRDEDALATLTVPKACFSLEAFLTKDGPFLMVFYAKCLLRPSEGKIPLSVSLPFSSCCRASWAPKRYNRITLMFRRASFRKTGFTTFDLTIERIGGETVIQAHQVASFLLPVHMESPIWMGVSDANMIIFESGSRLFLFTINGLLLQQFDDHQRSICNLWVDSLHVLTTSMDNYLHMYMWEEEGRYPYLRSCCHLEHRRDDSTPSCYVSKALCDNVSIVCVVSRSRESSILVMYSLNM